MPELPDLVYIEKKLKVLLANRSIVSVDIKEPIIFRVLVERSIDQTLAGAALTNVARRGPFLIFTLDREFELVVHPMLAGKFKHVEREHKGRSRYCFSLVLDNGHSLRYLDEKRMGKVYIVKQGDYERIPRLPQQGIDILSQQFTLDDFLPLIKKSRKQVRAFLMDQTVLSAIGNAYADEILFDAGIHPKTFCYQLSEAEHAKLYESVCHTIEWGIREVERAQQPIEVKVRGHMRVRNRKDQPCPRCGETIRRTGVHGHDTFFCPKCQPARRRQFIDWSES